MVLNVLVSSLPLGRPGRSSRLAASVPTLAPVTACIRGMSQRMRTRSISQTEILRNKRKSPGAKCPKFKCQEGQLSCTSLSTSQPRDGRSLPQGWGWQELSETVLDVVSEGRPEWAGTAVSVGNALYTSIFPQCLEAAPHSL